MVRKEGSITDCQSYYSTRVQCKGVTRSGGRCRRMTDNANGYCYQHQPWWVGIVGLSGWEFAKWRAIEVRDIRSKLSDQSERVPYVENVISFFDRFQKWPSWLTSFLDWQTTCPADLSYQQTEGCTHPKRKARLPDTDDREVCRSCSWPLSSAPDYFFQMWWVYQNHRPEMIRSRRGRQSNQVNMECLVLLHC